MNVSQANYVSTDDQKAELFRELYHICSDLYSNQDYANEELSSKEKKIRKY